MPVVAQGSASRPGASSVPAVVVTTPSMGALPLSEVLAMALLPVLSGPGWPAPLVAPAAVFSLVAPAVLGRTLAQLAAGPPGAAALLAAVAESLVLAPLPLVAVVVGVAVAALAVQLVVEAAAAAEPPARVGQGLAGMQLLGARVLALGRCVTGSPPAPAARRSGLRLRTVQGAPFANPSTMTTRRPGARAASRGGRAVRAASAWRRRRHDAARTSSTLGK